MGDFVSVYVDSSATESAVRQAVSRLPAPSEVHSIDIESAPLGDQFDCQLAVILHGKFGPENESAELARSYAATLSNVLGTPAFAFYDLLRGHRRAATP